MKEIICGALLSAAGGGSFLEFGSGGSTFLSLLHSKMQVFSVESDSNWLQYLKEWDFIQTHLNAQRLHFHHIDIGKVGAWGYPLEMEKKTCFPLYSSKIFQIKNDFDMVFIDGRFRVACALAAISHCGANTRIFIHDFNNRPQYHSVIEFLDFVDTCDTLAEFRIKDSIDRARLCALYEENQYNFA